MRDQDVATVCGMLARGDEPRHVASYFGVSEERIREVAGGRVNVTPAGLNDLPPPGPYLAGRTALKAIDTLIALRLLIDQAMDEMDVYERVSLRTAEDELAHSR